MGLATLVISENKPKKLRRKEAIAVAIFSFVKSSILIIANIFLIIIRCLISVIYLIE